MDKKSSITVNTLVKAAMLAALSIVLMYLVRFPIFPSAAYLEYDMADVPILIGTFMFGPLVGLAITLIVCVIQAISVSASSGWVGAVMHFIATGGLVIVAGLIYKKNHTRKGAVAGLLIGAFVSILLMIPLNLIMTPLFNGVPVDAVKAMLVPIIIPFNAIKAVINCTVTFVLYKALSRLFKRI
ncbi:MAG: ECF transporter S component [Clostridia bacterium]|nr:ECF transporter S component [Clostridia bacterium]